MTKLCHILYSPMNCNTPGTPVLHNLLEFAKIHVHCVADAAGPLLFLPSVFPSVRVFVSEPALHIRCPKYWSFSFKISPANEYLGLIFFRIDWFDLLVVQGSFKIFSSTKIQKH